MAVALNRRGKIVAALVLIVLVFLIFQNLSYVQEGINHYSDKIPNILKGQDKSASSDAPPDSQAPQSPQADQNEGAPSPPAEPSSPPSNDLLLAGNEEFVPHPSTLDQEKYEDAHLFAENAHRFESADDFLPHFNRVTEQTGMPLSLAKSGCTWDLEELGREPFQFMNDPKQPWVLNPFSHAVLEDRRQQMYEYIKTGMRPYADHKSEFEGRGIVIVGGGQEVVKRMQVTLRALQRLGSKLPVEIHYFNHELRPEMSEEDKAVLRDTYHTVYFSDLAENNHVIETHKNFYFNNYHLKTAALVNARFSEILHLDSDNIPVFAPDDLFETELYKEYGTIFWPDIARTRPENPMWAITNTKCRMDEYSQESGQMLINKKKFFYHLQVAYWLLESQTEFYRDFLLGDKDMFRFTWYALKTEYGSPKKFVTSVGTLNKHPDGKNFYCGHTFAQHHPNGSVAFLHGGALKTFKKPVLKYMREQRGGIFQTYKRSRNDEDHTKPGGALLKWDGAQYLPNKPEGMEVAWCSDMPKEEAKPLEEIIPGGFEHVFEELGGYWMLDDDEK